MEGTNGWIGKRISVFFDDGEKVTRKIGLCTNYTSDEIELDNKDIIIKSRVIRIEVEI